jgi:hypothetical protein
VDQADQFWAGELGVAPRVSEVQPIWPTGHLHPRGQHRNGRTESLGDDGLTSLASLRDIAPEEWEEAGIGPESRLFGLRVEDQIVAVAALGSAMIE